MLRTYFMKQGSGHPHSMIWSHPSTHPPPACSPSCWRWPAWSGGPWRWGWRPARPRRRPAPQTTRGCHLLLFKISWFISKCGLKISCFKNQNIAKFGNVMQLIHRLMINISAVSKTKTLLNMGFSGGSDRFPCPCGRRGRSRAFRAPSSALATGPAVWAEIKVTQCRKEVVPSGEA